MTWAQSSWFWALPAVVALAARSQLCVPGISQPINQPDGCSFAPMA